MYLYILIFHIFSFTAWFAGILYIWRLFVYHTESSSAEVKKQLEIMSYRLYKYIMRIAATITITTGIILFSMQWDTYKKDIWIWLKILLVCIVLGSHLLANYYRIQLKNGKQYKSKFFRIMNEIPTILLLIIIFLVILKPF